MACNPGTPCFPSDNITYPRGCGVDPCYAVKSNTDLVFYSGGNLSCTGVQTCDSLTLALQKLDEAICQLQAAITTTTTTTSTSSTTTTTTTSTSSTTTTTTTICPCTTFEFVGSDSELVTFEYVPCGSTLAIFVSPSSTPEYHCVNLAYPVTRVLGIAGSATNTNVCCP